ncbi:MAG: WD40/YVTN/BNR-like repeat-containing protein, partial [Saprospiraceae bacterium]
MRKTFRPVLPLCLFVFSSLFLHAQWAKTNGLPGGDVGGFLHYGDTVLANVGDELYFSANHGQTWSLMPLSNGVTLYESDADGHTILGRRYDPNTGYRLVRSEDFGQNWLPIASVDTMFFYETFLAFGYIYASDHNGLYRTNDDGATWEYVTTQFVGTIQFDGQRMTGVSQSGIVQSTDGGFTWNTILQVSGNVIDMLQHENHLFAFMQNANHGCYASSDYGQTWQQYTGLGFDQVYDFFWHNGAIYGLDSDQLRKSPDLGQTWVNAPLPPDAYYPAFNGVSTGNAILIAGFYNTEPGSILRSTDDGDSWFAADFGTVAASGKLRSIGNTLHAASQGGIFQLDTDGVNWTKQVLNYTPSQFSSGGFTDYVQSGDNLLFSQGGSPQVSLDGGATWYESFVPGQPWGGGIPYLEAVGDKVLGIGDDIDFSTFYTSDNHGLTFLPIESLYDQHQTQIAMLDVDQGKAFALGYDHKIYRSDDGCNSWVLQAGQIPTDSIGGFSRLMVRGNVIVLLPAYYVKKMLYSKDAGQTWTFINLATAGLPFGDGLFNDLLYIGNYLVAANKNGVFLSQNDGTDWAAWNDGMNTTHITNLEVHDGYLWAATSGNGIWKRSLTELGMKPVAGKVFFDENANALQDPGEPNLPNVVVQSLSTNAYTNSRPDGTYDLLSNLAQEQLKVHPPKTYWLATPATQTVAVPSAGADFALSLDPAAKDLSVQLTNASVLRPGFETNYVLHWRNHVPIAATGVSLTLTYPTDLLDLLESIPAPTTQSGGTLTWELGDVAAESVGNILLRFKVPVSVLLGTEVCATAAISPLAGDLAPNDNAREHCEPVVGSFDPNDKQAEPSDFLTPAQLAANDPITYTVRFQNTGNYPAAFVRIADTLQQNFDPASFQFLSSSHPCTWSLRGQGEVEFFFSNIELPPTTTDEPGSHGFVKYSVRPRQNLPLGTPLRNTAHIFFDFNAPVTTNTTET